MREITYSQGLIIDDPSLLTTLAVFCKQVWLPNTQPAEDVAAAFAATIAELGPEPRIEAIVKAIRSDDTPARIQSWEQQHKLLFQENVIKRLSILISPFIPNFQGIRCVGVEE